MNENRTRRVCPWVTIPRDILGSEKEPWYASFGKIISNSKGPQKWAVCELSGSPQAISFNAHDNLGVTQAYRLEHGCSELNGPAKLGNCNSISDPESSASNEVRTCSPSSHHPAGEAAAWPVVWRLGVWEKKPTSVERGEPAHHIPSPLITGRVSLASRGGREALPITQPTPGLPCCQRNLQTPWERNTDFHSSTRWPN